MRKHKLQKQKTPQGSMKKFKFLPPYKREGKTNFPETQRRSGVYIIKEDSRIVYVGMSGGNLYKTLYRHFETWDHPYQEVTTYAGKKNKYLVRIVLCTPGQAARLERYLIKKLNPRDNTVKYEHYKIEFIDEKTYQAYQETKTIDEVPF